MAWDSVKPDLLIAACFLIIVYVFMKLRNRNKQIKLPPGPNCFRFLESIRVFKKEPHLALMEMTKKYGDVIRTNFLFATCVSLNSTRSIREAFGKPEFLGRPDEMFTNMSTMKMPLLSSGKLWLEHRRFMLRAFRDLGLGKTKMHELIAEEVGYVLNKLESEEGIPCDFRKILTPSTANNICSLVFGKRYEYNDPERIFLDEKMAEQAKLISSATILSTFPWLKKIPMLSRLLKLDKLLENDACLKRFISKKIEEHKENFDDHHLRDFVDTYISEMNSRKERDPNTTLSEDCMPGTILILFTAGAETVRSSVEWALYTMALYPEIQKKVQQKIDNVIGSERKPLFDDMKNLPYIQAVLTELQRWKTVVPIGPPRKALEDAELRGYTIPKGTMVIANFWAAHNDPLYWKNPSEFKPERFLTAEGKYSNKHDNYLPFSMGKRACPGEGLALMEIFLYFTSILQKFTVAFPGGKEPEYQVATTVVFQLLSCELLFMFRTK